MKKERVDSRAIKLGLDLQGGMYVLLELDEKTLVEKLATTLSEDLKSIIQEANQNSIKLNKIIQALTCNPAKILKIEKGNLSIGNDADFCIVDIYKPWIVKKEKLMSKSKNTSIDDRKLQGKVMNTFVKGEELFKN